MRELGIPVDLAARTRRLAQGRVLVGGSPTTVMRLSQPFHEAHSSTHLGRRMLATGIGVPRLDRVPQPPPDQITVVVPVRGRASLLDRCLAALAPMDVVVVDDGSRRSDQIAAVTARHGARLVRLPVSRGPAAARNTGLDLVQTPLVAFVDSDIEVGPEILLEVARHLADPEVSLAAPRVRSLARHPAKWFERYEAAVGSLDLGAVSAEVRPGTMVSYLPSACMIARVSELGLGFDPTLLVGEDVDLCWRLLAVGRRARYEAGVVAHHRVRASVRGWLGRKVAYGSSAAPLADRHGRHVAPAALAPAPTLAAILVLLRSRWAVPAVIGSLVVSGRRVTAATGHGEPVASQANVMLAFSSLQTALRQVSGLVLRHWWPVTALGLACGHRPPFIRRIALDALLFDAVVAWTEEQLRRRRGDELLPLPVLLAGRRSDDLAYGAGLWRGVIATGSVRALLPRLILPRARRASRS